MDPILLPDVPWKITQIRVGLKARREELTKEQRVFEKERDVARRKFHFTGARRRTPMEREIADIDDVRAALGFIANALADDEEDDDEEDE